MDMHTFMIMLASPLLLAVSVAVVFIWAAKAKTPEWVKSSEGE
ncbi:cytochrome bd oxidase small subunit CydS [Salisediminibacterium beveridgei]|nr:hypothetical protein [Salisediminibacterium beveridgei]